MRTNPLKVKTGTESDLKSKISDISNHKSQIKNLGIAGDTYATATGSTKEKKEG
jgi:hypothetical protein